MQKAAPTSQQPKIADTCSAPAVSHKATLSPRPMPLDRRASASICALAAMSESPKNTPLGDDLPMKWKLLGILIFMRQFYKFAGLVVEAAPVGKNIIRAGWRQLYERPDALRALIR
jgi:hypothetical protein